MFGIDLHTHTRFFHRFDRAGEVYDPVGARLLAWTARAYGLDGVAHTNHNYYRPVTDAGMPGAVATIPGIEVSTTRGHVLVVGPDPPRSTDPNTITPQEIIEIAHDRGCAAILAHPYRNSTIRELDLPFDAIEINGKHPRTEIWASELARDRGVPLVGGSDAHYPVEVGRAYTEFEIDRPTPENVVDAIKSGRVEPAVQNQLPHRIIRRAYHYIHKRKGVFEQPDAPPQTERSTED